MMSRVFKGMVAGFAGALVVAAMEAAQWYAGPWVASYPQLLSIIMGTSAMHWTGWAAHLAMGALVLGPIFGVLCPRLPTETPETKGILFAVAAFVVMGLTLAPLGGIGTFGVRAGFPAVAWLLVTQAAFGVVLGAVYGKLVGRDWRPHPARDDIHLAH